MFIRYVFVMQIFPPPFIFCFFSSEEPDIKDYDIQRLLHIYEKLGGDHTCPRKGAGSENTRKDKFTLQAVGQPAIIKIINKMTNHGERGKSDFQNYHIT